MKKKIPLAIAFILAFLPIAATIFQSVRLASAQTFENITIKADGSIDPSTAPIQRSGDVYTLVGDIDDYVLLERNNTIFDGAGHAVGGIYGPLPVQVAYEWQANATTNVSIVNAVINGDGIFFLASYNSIFANNTLNNGRGLDCTGDGNVIANNTVNNGRGIAGSGNGNMISGNRLTNCNYTFVENNPPPYGIGITGSNNTLVGNYIVGTNGTAIILGTSSFNTIFENHIANNKLGISTQTLYTAGYAYDNTIYCNNFINNSLNYYNEVIIGNTISVNIWDFNSVGNYWSDYGGTDADGNGIGDTPYVIDTNNQDRYPLMNPVDITNVTLPFSSPSPTPTPTPTPTEPAATPSPEPFPTTLVIASAITVAVVGVGLFVYFKKRKH